jgi:MFS family permease
MSTRRTILALSICMALHMTSFVMILPLFARRFNELGAGVKALGVSAMAYALAGALAAPFMGALADRFGRKPLVLASLGVNVVAFCGYLFAPSAAAFILLRGLAGAFTAGLIPAVTGLAAELAPNGRQAQWIGFMNAGASIGWIAGPLAGGVIYDRWGYCSALIVSVLLALLPLLAAALYIPGNRQASPSSFTHGMPIVTGRSAKNIRHFLPQLRSTLPDSLSSFAVLLVIYFAVLFAWAFIEPRFMFYAYNDLGWSSSMLGLVMSTYGIAMGIGELVFGGLSDRLGRKPVILTGLVLFSAQFIGLAAFRSYWLLAAAFVIAGLGNALYDPALSASILDISPQEQRSRSLGIKSMIGSSGSILGYALVSLLNSSVEARSIFLIAVGIVFLTMLIGLSYPINPINKPRICRLADAG